MASSLSRIVAKNHEKIVMHTCALSLTIVLYNIVLGAAHGWDVFFYYTVRTSPLLVVLLVFLVLGIRETRRVNAIKSAKGI